MNDTKEITNILNTYAQIADDLGDYKTADECYELMKEAETFENSSIRTAATREAFLKKLWQGIKNVGKAIDRGVRKIVPGGWGTIIGFVAAPYLAKLPASMKATGGKVLKFVQSGGDPTTLLNSTDPLVQDAAKMFMSQAQSATGGQATTGGGTSSVPFGSPGAITYGTYPPTGTPTTVKNEKQTKLNSITSILYRSSNEAAAKEAFNTFVKFEVPAFNQAVPSDKQITSQDINSLKSQMKTQKGFNL